MSETDINAPATQRMDVPTIRAMAPGTIYMARVWCHVAGRNVWHSWHDDVGMDHLTRQVCDTYSNRLNTTVIALFTACIVPDKPQPHTARMQFDGTCHAFVNGKMLRDEHDNRMVFGSYGIAEAEVERVCRARL